MADDKNKNEDPEDNDDLFDDDEDFGLPDLDYDDLDEEFDDELLDEDDEVVIGAEPTVAESTKEEEETTAEAVTESPAADTSDSPEEEIDINDEDLASMEDDIEDGDDWEKELEKELEDELGDGDVDAFYEEESFDEFEAEEADANLQAVVGAPEAAMEPDRAEDAGFVADDSSDDKDDYYISHIQKEEEAKAKESAEEMSEEEYKMYFGDAGQKNKSKFTRTVVIGTISFLAIGLLCLFLYKSLGSGDDKKVAKTEKVTPKKTTQPAAKPVEKPVEKKETPKEKLKPKATKQNPGEIKTLASATGKSYIVIASFFDGDMANDRAERMAKEGKSPMIIPPFNEYRFYRVAIAEFDSFADAKSSISQYQAEYGQDIWPLRY